METRYPPYMQYGTMALLLDGCTVSGVSRHLGINRNTVEKWRSRIPTALHSHNCNEEEFKARYLRPDYASAIKKRTADGHAGLIDGHTPYIDAGSADFWKAKDR